MDYFLLNSHSSLALPEIMYKIFTGVEAADWLFVEYLFLRRKGKSCFGAFSGSGRSDLLRKENSITEGDSVS